MFVLRRRTTRPAARLCAAAWVALLTAAALTASAAERPEARPGIEASEVTRPAGDYAALKLTVTVPDDPQNPDRARREGLTWTWVGAVRDGRVRVDDGVGIREPGGFLELKGDRLAGRFRRVDLGAEVSIDAKAADGAVTGTAKVGDRDAKVHGILTSAEQLARENAVAADESWPAAQGPLMGGCSSEWTGAATIDDPARMRLVWRSEESDIGRGMGNITRFMHTWGSASQRRTGSGCASPIVADGKVFFKYYLPAPREPGQPEMRHPNYGVTEAAGIENMLKEAREAGFKGEKLPEYAAEKVYQNVDDVVVCMDAASGRTLWKAIVRKRPTEGEQHYNSQHHKAGPFDMSPATANGRVFALGMTGWLYAFDAASGKPLWEVKCGLDYSNALLAVGDVLVAPAGGEWGGYDAATGKLLWTAGGGRGVSTLSAWSHGGKDYVLGRMGPGHAPAGIACLEAATGKEVWRLTVNVMTGGRGLGPGGISIVGDTLLVYQDNGTGVKNEPILPALAAYRLSPEKAEPLWQLAGDGPPSEGGHGPVHGESVPVVVRGKYVFTADLRVVDLATGKVLDQSQGIVPMNGGFMQAIEDLVLVRRDGTHGNMECGFYKVGPDGSVRSLTGEAAWVPPVGGTTTSYHHPLFYAMVDGRIFFRQENGVYCWDVRAERAMDRQSIEFPPIPHQPEDARTVEVEARASSGLPVALRVLSGPATADGGAVRLSGAPGIVTVEARQPGGRDHLAAPPVERVFHVGKPVPEIPRDVRAAGTASTVALVEWRHDGRFVDTFEVERCRDGSTWQSIGVTPAGERDLVDKALAPSTAYQYRLVAANAFFRSEPSPAAKAVTTARDHTRYVEAEDAKRGDGWAVVEAEGASGGKALSAVNAPRDGVPAGPADIASFEFDWPVAGPVTVWLRGRSPFGGTSESGHVRVDDGAWTFLAFPTSGQWSWQPLELRMPQGRGVIQLGIREPRLQVDRLFITNGEGRPQ